MLGGGAEVRETLRREEQRERRAAGAKTATGATGVAAAAGAAAAAGKTGAEAVSGATGTEGAGATQTGAREYTKAGARKGSAKSRTVSYAFECSNMPVIRYNLAARASAARSARRRPVSSAVVGLRGSSARL